MAPNLIDPAMLLQCNNLDCRPPAPAPPRIDIPQQRQSIDYLAKDYDSFLRGMMDLIPSRLPGWKTRTEADLGMALLELFAYVGDQLSYYQDRVANEGYLRTAVEYESVRRLLRLIDYQLSPGVAAQALLKVTTTQSKPILKGFTVTTKGTNNKSPLVYEVTEDRIIYPDLNVITLNANAASGANQAVLNGELDLFLLSGQWMRLESPSNSEWAQLDTPILVNSMLHTTTVKFTTALKGDYDKANTSVNGNGLVATNGESHLQSITSTGEANQRVELDFAPLTYVQTAGGGVQSSLVVQVAGKTWNQVEDFIDGQSTDTSYTLTRDNQGFVTVNFGNGQQGRRPGVGVPIEVRYRSGVGEPGLVAPGTLTEFEDPDGAIARTTLLPNPIVNPEASFGAKNPAKLAEAKLLGPRTVHRQNRAVTQQDYSDALLQGVPMGNAIIKPLHAKAQFIWTGSWNTVTVSVDFADRVPLADLPDRRRVLEDALQTKKVAGFDVQVEDARYAPINIALVVHVQPEYFVKQVRQQIETAIGPLGFFAPTQFGFGDAVRLSDLYSAVMAVKGVRYLTVSIFKRLGDRYPDRSKNGVIEIGALEISRCDNDRIHPENGVLSVRICGGKEG